MIRKYHNHKPQTNPWHHEEESHNHRETPGRQTKQNNQLSLLHQDYCKSRMNVQQNIEQLQSPTMRVTINKATKSAFNVGPPSAPPEKRHLNGVSLADRRCPAYRSIWILSSTIKTKQKTLSKLDPSDKTFWIRACT